MHKIKVYSTPTCPYCVTLKQYLKSNNIEFEDLDVSFDVQAQKEMIEGTGQMGVPVVNIDGEQWIIGFDKEKIDKILNIQ